MDAFGGRIRQSLSGDLAIMDDRALVQTRDRVLLIIEDNPARIPATDRSKIIFIIIYL
ncbi:MAG: hypothetical protein JO009_04710 [Candidatus Eremiobacteraeota bacterium]|nr:hypothetical protein [Candidatus Eremiobacteraeota bacterium]